MAETIDRIVIRRTPAQQVVDEDRFMSHWVVATASAFCGSRHTIGNWKRRGRDSRHRAAGLTCIPGP
jgi:hypothetical protein